MDTTCCAEPTAYISCIHRSNTRRQKNQGDSQKKRTDLAIHVKLTPTNAQSLRGQPQAPTPGKVLAAALFLTALSSKGQPQAPTPGKVLVAAPFPTTLSSEDDGRNVALSIATTSARSGLLILQRWASQIHTIGP